MSQQELQYMMNLWEQLEIDSQQAYINAYTLNDLRNISFLFSYETPF